MRGEVRTAAKMIGEDSRGEENDRRQQKRRRG